MSDVERRVGREEIERRLRAGLMVGTAAWGALVAQRAKTKAPVQSGRLARSVHVGDVVQAGDIAYRIDVGTNVEYARAVEEGSGLFSIDPQFRRLILIEPRYRKALAFAWPGAPSGAPGFSKKTGKYVLKRVWHPGVKPRPFLRPAARESRPEGHVLVISAIRAELVR
jgi:hypothetical protein